jgi:cytochrome c oxidase subunit 2
VKRRSLIRIGAPTAAFLLFNTACASSEAPLDWLRPAGPIGREIGDLWTIVFYVAVGVFFLVEGAILYACVKFRRRKGDDVPPKQTHGNTPLEIGWTIAPALILATLAIPTLSGIWALAQERPNSLHVTVSGHQWWWEYKYADEEWSSANELHIPTGRPVQVSLESEDVIHSFWVPRLAGKQDVVPGRTNAVTLQADRPGEFQGTCAEFCGLSHANMRFRVFAHEPADFERWLADQREEAAEPRSALAREGRTILLGQQCVDCHTIRGTKAAGQTAPDLTHFASRTTFAGAIFPRNPENLQAWVSDAPSEKPGALMPSGVKDMGLKPEEIEAIVAYLQSLR